MLNSTMLKKEIQKNLKKNGFLSISQNSLFCEALAKAVVSHIQKDSTVVVNKGSSSGVYKVS